jgi:diguanylate cyclase (GGDEF)-like protein
MEIAYSPWLVALSIAVAMVVSYSSLSMAARVAEARNIANPVWLVLGACSMGTGVWAMHFIGMLALSMPIRLTYSVGVIVIALGGAIVTSGIAIYLGSRPRRNATRHLISSVVLGLGIATLHYTSMHALLIVPGIRYAIWPLLASVAIAIAASWLAIWLNFFLRTRVHHHKVLARIGAALVMGGAISGMHYTGMAAMIIAPNAICAGGVQLDNGWFAVSLAVAALGMLVITSMTSIFDSHLASRARLYAESLAQADRALLHQATHDLLTGLPNRAHFLDCLRQAVERVRRGEQSNLAVLFLDLDRFKFVNDTQGHRAGDELLKQIAERLEGVIRNGDHDHDKDNERGAVWPDIISRFSGDEFLVLLNGLQRELDAQSVAARLQAALAPTYMIQDREVHCSASIGIVTSGTGAVSADDIMRNADLAMYEAKRAGRARAMQFSSAMHERVARQVAIETNLRRAIGTSEMHVLYQPIVDLATWRIASVEALVRWRHPTLGVIAPSEFIPIAEETGLIIPLDRWVREQACRAMKNWLATDPGGAPDTVSVNVSRVELAQSDEFRWKLVELLNSMQMPASRLQLEVTERNVMCDPDATLKLTRELKTLGVKLAMDDFGTGTSSLSVLRTFPFDVIKVDRSFVQGLDTGADVRAVMHATIGLVERLGMSSLVEGIEETSQLAMVSSMGCGLGQGWLFSAPVAAREVPATADRLRMAAGFYDDETRRTQRLKLG